MERFSYALEFYREGIYDLNNVDYFAKKVKEAEKVESYFTKLVPNTDFIRPYIMMSYKFEKVIGYENRIRYVRGLVYASDYIDFIDAINIPKDLDYFEELGLKYIDFKKQSLWGFTAYVEGENTDEILSGRILEEENDNEDEVEEVTLKPTEENVFELKKEEFDSMLKLIDEVMNLDDSDDIPNDNEKGNEDENDTESYISIEEKLSRFKRNSNDYIENLLKDKLKNKVIKKDDIPMMKRAMKRWFRKIFYIIDKIVEFDSKEYTYKDENIVRFL